MKVTDRLALVDSKDIGTKDYTDENVDDDGIPTGTIMTTASQETDTEKYCIKY